MKFFMTSKLRLMTPSQLEGLVDELRKKYRKKRGRPGAMTVPGEERVFRTGQSYYIKPLAVNPRDVMVGTVNSEPGMGNCCLTDAEISYIQQWLDLLCPGVKSQVEAHSENRWIRVKPDDQYSIHVLMVILHYILIGPQNAC